MMYLCPIQESVCQLAPIEDILRSSCMPHSAATWIPDHLNPDRGFLYTVRCLFENKSGLYIFPFPGWEICRIPRNGWKCSWSSLPDADRQSQDISEYPLLKGSVYSARCSEDPVIYRSSFAPHPILNDPWL